MLCEGTTWTFVYLLCLNSPSALVGIEGRATPGPGWLAPPSLSLHCRREMEGPPDRAQPSPEYTYAFHLASRWPPLAVMLQSRMPQPPWATPVWYTL